MAKRASASLQDERTGGDGVRGDTGGLAPSRGYTGPSGDSWPLKLLPPDGNTLGTERRRAGWGGRQRATLLEIYVALLLTGTDNLLAPERAPGQEHDK